MIVVRDQHSVAQIANPDIRALAMERIHALAAQGFELEDVGHFIIIELSDTVQAIEQHLGVSISACEPPVTQYPYCLDAIYVLDQAGKGIEMFVPIGEGVDRELLSMLQLLALPAPEPGMP